MRGAAGIRLALQSRPAADLPPAIIATNTELAGKCLEIGTQCGKQCGKDFFLLSFDTIHKSGRITGVGLLCQQYRLFRPRIEQWLRRVVHGDRSAFTARVPIRLLTT